MGSTSGVFTSHLNFSSRLCESREPALVLEIWIQQLSFLQVRFPTSGIPQYAALLLLYPSLMWGTTPLGWMMRKTKDKKPGVWKIFCILNSFAGIGQRMLSISQISQMTWKKLRRRWVLMVMSPWISLSSSITFLLSRWAELFSCTVTEKTSFYHAHGGNHGANTRR